MESVDNPLHEAAKRGNVMAIEEGLANGVSVNGLDKVCARMCVCMGAVGHATQSGSTALHWAARCGHEDCVAALLARPGVEVNVQNKIGDTALHSAAWKGAASVAQLLLDKGACMHAICSVLSWHRGGSVHRQQGEPDPLPAGQGRRCGQAAAGPPRRMFATCTII